MSVRLDPFFFLGDAVNHGKMQFAPELALLKEVSERLMGSSINTLPTIQSTGPSKAALLSSGVLSRWAASRIAVQEGGAMIHRTCSVPHSFAALAVAILSVSTASCSEVAKIADFYDSRHPAGFSVLFQRRAVLRWRRYHDGRLIRPAMRS